MAGYTVEVARGGRRTSSATTRARCGSSRYVIDAEQVALTYRRMPQHTGGKGSYGHRHRTQEEIYFVDRREAPVQARRRGVEAAKGTAVRVSPEVVRSVWNDEPEDAELVIVSMRIDDGRGRRGAGTGLLARVTGARASVGARVRRFRGAATASAEALDVRFDEDLDGADRSASWRRLPSRREVS